MTRQLITLLGLLWLCLLLSVALNPSIATYTADHILCKGQCVPTAIWSPGAAPTAATSSSSTDANYQYAISVPRIAKLLLGLPLPKFSFLSSAYSLPAGSPRIVANQAGGASNPYSASSPLVVVSHGYLGSRFDLSPICEALALRGITTVAPEFPESLSASYEVGDSGLERVDIVNAILDGHVGPVGFLGHSLGTGLTLSYPLAGAPRCAVAGFRGVTEACEESALLVVASDGDSVCPGKFIRERVEEAEKATSRVASIEKLFFERYNHISFLSSSTNDAMVEFLSPLLPLAKTLKVPLLDFDKYAEVRDSDACQEEIVDIICQFFESNLVSL